MMRSKSLKFYVISWIAFLALCLSAILSYQSTQAFLKAFDMSTYGPMIHFRNSLPDGATELDLPLDYHIASDWSHVPDIVREKFPFRPTVENHQLKLFEDWTYFSPPGASYRVMMVRNDEGAKRYISLIQRFSEKTDLIKTLKGEVVHIDPMKKIALWGIASLLVFIVTIMFIFRTIAKPIAGLSFWAGQLDLDNLKRPLPDFRFNELNFLAGLFHGRMKVVEETLNNEKEFLQYASHELRTPLTVLHSNISLLDKIDDQDLAKATDVKSRIRRASYTMKGITETLLWLYRDDSDAVDTGEVELDELLAQVVEDHRYLMQGKRIELSVNCQPVSAKLPEAAFRILLNNIVRNAFQHTQQGQVSISLNAQRVEVTNSLDADMSAGASSGIDTAGFGLGLKLVQKLVHRFSWRLEQAQEPSQNRITIYF